MNTWKCWHVRAACWRRRRGRSASRRWRHALRRRPACGHSGRSSSGSAGRRLAWREFRQRSFGRQVTAAGSCIPHDLTVPMPVIAIVPATLRARYVRVLVW